MYKAGLKGGVQDIPLRDVEFMTKLGWKPVPVFPAELIGTDPALRLYPACFRCGSKEDLIQIIKLAAQYGVDISKLKADAYVCPDCLMIISTPETKERADADRAIKDWLDWLVGNYSPQS